MSPKQPPAALDVRRALTQRLWSLKRSGVDQLARPCPVQPAAADSGDAEIARPATTTSTILETQAAGSTMNRSAAPGPIRARAGSCSLFDTPTTVETVPPEQRGEALKALAREAAGCVRCAELAASRTQTVFGVGNPEARLVFFGEAPGADEDRQGEPFVGRAGQLLTKIIQACQMSRGDVYIMNVLKCRPPGNRNPTPDEAAHCRGFYERQFEIIRPEFICCLGRVAAGTLLETTESIGRLRGRFHDYRGVRVLVTYHPAYLLRNPSAKRQVWEDMQMLMREMGIEVKGRR